MAGNSFGNIFKLSSFGESHGKALGGVIDGCPAGVKIDLDFIDKELNRRRPGQSEIVTQRKEDDSVEFLSGIFEGKTTGTPIGFIIVNKDQKSKDYSHIQNSYRHLMQILYMIKNMVLETIGVEVEVLQERQLLGL